MVGKRVKYLIFSKFMTPAYPPYNEISKIDCKGFILETNRRIVFLESFAPLKITPIFMRD